MKILAMGKAAFDQLMKQKSVTPDNVEQQDKILFISINTTEETSSGDRPYFPEDKKNVKVLFFDDVEKNITVPLFGTNDTYEAKAMTEKQAEELYSFIRANVKGKEVVLVHCTAGVSRSGAVASFIHDFSGGNWEQFKTLNMHISPNAHVYRLLHDQWYKDLAYPE
jgi:predicted protein tyrosine phosphatase